MKLQIQNFQSHKDTALEFIPGINAIVGLSDSGKSSILRALDFVINNKPSGDDFVSRWGGDCVVTLSDDNWQIGRVKGKGKNQYFLNMFDGSKGRVFEGFNREVPEPIKKVLNMQDFNIRFQHQGPFLIGESSGEISRYFNRVARLDIIDKAEVNIKNGLKKEQDELSKQEANAIRFANELKRFEELPSIESQVIKCEALELEIAYQNKEHTEIFNLVESFEAVEKQLITPKKIITLTQQVNNSINLKENIDKSRDQVLVLAWLKTQVAEVQQEMIKAKQVIAFGDKVSESIKQLQGFEALEVRYQELDKLWGEGVVLSDDVLRYEHILSRGERVQECIKLYDTCGDLTTKWRIFNALVSDCREFEVTLKMAKGEHLKLQKEFAVLMPSKCPLCGRGSK